VFILMKLHPEHISCLVVGEGCFYAESCPDPKYRSGWRHVKFRVSNIPDLHGRVLPFFRKHELFGRKRAAFDVFAELVELLHAREHLTLSGLEECKAVAARLTEHNRGGRRVLKGSGAPMHTRPTSSAAS
jgi:hypothetical protein